MRLSRPHQGWPPRAFRPKCNSPCLCGSNRKFKNCCRQRLPGLDIGKKARQAKKTENLPKALIACRADITQYTIWHKSHTEPAMQHGISRIEFLLNIDINALAAYVSDLCWLYIRTDQQAAFSAVLERLRGNINEARWQRKISYLHTLNALGRHWNRDDGRKEFEKLGVISSNEDDLDILRLYIDLFGDEISFSDRIKLFDRILSLSDTIGDRLQYQGAKASEHLLIGDTKKADHELSEAIEFCHEAKSIDDLTSYERLRLSDCLELLAFIRRDEDLFQEAIGLRKELLKEEGWTDEGRANLYRQLGDCYRYAGAWNDAESAYKDALSFTEAPICEVFLSQALLRQDKSKDAIKIISCIRRNDLNPLEFEDFVFAFTDIAIEMGDAIQLKEAKNLLEKLNVSSPYFNNRRLELLVHVQDTMEK